MNELPLAVLCLGFAAGTFAFAGTVRLLVWLGNRYQHRFGSAIDRELARLHLFVDARRLMWAHLCLVAMLAVIATALTGRPWFALAVVMVAALMPRLALLFLARRRLERFRHQLPDAMAMLAGGLRAGLGLGAVLPQAAERLSSPVRDELRMIERQRRLGATLEQALAGLEHRIPLEETRLLVSVLATGARAGGSMASTLDAQAALLRRRLLLEGKIRALTAQARLQAWVMAALPFGVLAAMIWLDPSIGALYFDTAVGRAVLLTVLVLQLAGAWTIVRLVAIEV